jgi:hypothetical protein
VEELLEAIIQILNAIPIDTFIDPFHECAEKLQAYIDTGGEYVE